MLQRYLLSLKLLEKRTFLLCSALVLTAKIGYSFVTGFPGGTYEDWHIADNLVNRGVYAEFIDVGPTAYKLPAYSIFLSFFIAVFGNFAKEAAVIAQHILFFIIPLQMIGLFRLFNREKVGILTAYLFILSPVYLYYSNVMEVTNIFIPLLLLWLGRYLMVFKSGNAGRKDIILLGIISSALFLTQVIVVPLVLVLLTVLVFQNKLRMAGLALWLVIMSLFYAPWVIRNYIVFEKVIVTKSPFWQNIYLSFIPQVNFLDEVKLISLEHDLYTMELKKKVNEFKMEQIYRAEVQRVLQGREELFFVKAVQNAVILWYVPTRYIDQQTPGVYLRKVQVIVLNLLTLIAIVFIYRRYRLLFCFSLLFFGAFTAPYMIGHAANMRFKLDFEWYQYALVALFLYERCSLFRNREETSRKVAAQSPVKTES